MRGHVIGLSHSKRDAQGARVSRCRDCITPIPSAPALGGIAVGGHENLGRDRGKAKLVLEWDEASTRAYRNISADLERQRASRLTRAHAATRTRRWPARRRRSAASNTPSSRARDDGAAGGRRELRGGIASLACVKAPDSTLANVTVDAEDTACDQTLLSGVGRKSKPDFVAEAALVSRAVDGKPVKLTWTREDDIAHDYFHAVALERSEAAVDASGKPLAWLHRTTAPSIGSLFEPDSTHQRPGELAHGLTDLGFFGVPNLRIENPAAAAHTRIGWLRSVYNIPHAFATQCAAAELAHLADRDPKDFLLELIGAPRKVDPTTLANATNYGEDPAHYPIDTARLRGVIEAVAKQANWGRVLPKGSGLGIAGHRSFVSYTAAVVEVAVAADGTLTIPRVDIAIDCGPQVNPERVRSQMEGSVIQGISLALLGEITFASGRAVQSNFHDYALTRIDAAPRDIRVHMLGADDDHLPMGGVGEPGLPPIAPALLNAIFAATGTRIRSLPVADQLSTASSAVARTKF